MKTVNRDSIWLSAIFENLFLDNSLDVPNNYKTFSTPAVNIIENFTKFGIDLAAPGLKKEDFSIEIDKDTLKISSKSSEKKEDNTAKDTDSQIKRRELNYKDFSRSFKLPEHIQVENIQASYENGILRVTLPKMEEKKALKKMVEIS